MIRITTAAPGALHAAGAVARAAWPGIATSLVLTLSLALGIEIARRLSPWPLGLGQASATGRPGGVYNPPGTLYG